MNNEEEKVEGLLAESYKRKIGRMTFQVSSFGNDHSGYTAHQLILQMLGDRIA